MTKFQKSSKTLTHVVSCQPSTRTLLPNKPSNLGRIPKPLTTGRQRPSDHPSSQRGVCSFPIIFKPCTVSGKQKNQLKNQSWGCVHVMGKQTCLSASKNSVSPFFFFFSTCLPKYLSSNLDTSTPEMSTLVEVPMT